MGSQRFPGKLLVKIEGKTVLQRTFESARGSKKLDALFVATDSDEIASHIHSLGGEVIWTSPHCQNGTQRIQEALLQGGALARFPFILNVQGDHPCLSPRTMEAVIEALREAPDAAVSTAVAPLKEGESISNPHLVKCVFDQKGYALYFSRSPIPYRGAAYAHIGIYGYRAEYLRNFPKERTPLQVGEDLEQLRILELGEKIKVALVDEIPLAIDTPEDAKLLEHYLTTQRSFL